MISIATIGNVVNKIDDIYFNDYRHTISEIHINESFTAESLKELDQFSHLEVLFLFHRVGKTDRTFNAKAPLPTAQEFPQVGIFALRTNDRPSRIGQTIVKLENIEDKVIYVRGLDALNGTPVIDIKPVIREMLPALTEIMQPSWARDMMRYYR
jgi:tRNA-Thr(GGU) m(6)t(6)A37 methyltransferase TsaA